MIFSSKPKLMGFIINKPVLQGKPKGVLQVEMATDIKLCEEIKVSHKDKYTGQYKTHY